MLNKIKKAIRNKLIRRLGVNEELLCLEKFINLSFSQEGEDLVLSSFSNNEKGFYVDIGAHHPMRFSNTYKFYLKGWKGINIDPMPGSMAIFDEQRPRDINLELAVSNARDTLKYYIFNETALNTFSEEEANKKNTGVYKIVEVKETQTYTLKEILDMHLPPDTEIDFFDIDVEGFDLAVLQSNDWTKYRPKMILAEALSTNINMIGDNEIYKYLTSMGYELVSKTLRTCFYKDAK